MLPTEGYTPAPMHPQPHTTHASLIHSALSHVCIGIAITHLSLGLSSRIFLRVFRLKRCVGTDCVFSEIICNRSPLAVSTSTSWLKCTRIAQCRGVLVAKEGRLPDTSPFCGKECGTGSDTSNL
jgi:hypothetical protein